MPPVVTQTVFAVFVNGSQVMTTGDVLVNEAFGNLCRVAEFELAEQPATLPEEGDPVVIRWLDYETETSWDSFGGTVDEIEIESDPWSMIVRCTDQLEKLRRVPETDRDWSGFSVTDAMEDILTFCGVTYDVADLVPIAYVLGQEMPVTWLAGTPGAQVAADLNAVFRLALQTVQDNRVIWFRPDLPPADATGQYRTFTKGTDADWLVNRRAHGGRDAIQNRWEVYGASVPCGTDDACTCQVWAKAAAANPQLGSAVKVAPQSVSSDLIQDEAVAEFLVRDLMGETNRYPDTATIDTDYDPNVHPGTKLGLIDPTYGIEADAVRRCTVVGVDVTGGTLTATAMCGAPGSAGTVTTGVDKVCSDVHTPIDWPGSFTPPDFSFPGFDLPDLDLGFDFDPFGLDPLNLDLGFGIGLGIGFPDGIGVVGGDGGGGGPGGGESLLGVNAANWVQASASFTASAGDLVTDQQGGGRYGERVDMTEDWSIDATFVMEPAVNPQDISIGVGTSGGSVTFGVTLYDAGGTALEIYAHGDFDSVNGPPYFPENTAIALALDWDATTAVLTYAVSDGTTSIGNTLANSGLPGFNVYPMVGAGGTAADTGGITCTQFDFTGTLL